MTREEAVALGPNFYLNRYFAAWGSQLHGDERYQSGFLQAGQWGGGGIAGPLKTYVSWHVLNASAPWLSEPFVDANFKVRQTLTGQKENQARWKRCVELTDGELGEALGQRYVDVTFGAEGKARMLKMVDALEKSLGEDIQNLSWMWTNQETGRGEAGGDSKQDRLSRQMARLQSSYRSSRAI